MNDYLFLINNSNDFNNKKTNEILNNQKYLNLPSNCLFEKKLNEFKNKFKNNKIKILLMNNNKNNFEMFKNLLNEQFNLEILNENEKNVFNERINLLKKLNFFINKIHVEIFDNFIENVDECKKIYNETKNIINNINFIDIKNEENFNENFNKLILIEEKVFKFLNENSDKNNLNFFTLKNKYN